MSPLWAIAKKLLYESFEKRTPIILCLLLLLAISTFPFILRSDGTLQGQLQMTITYSFALTLTTLSLLTLFLGTASFTGEIKYKQFYLIEAKPVHRWQFFWGKFVGLAILNVLFLVILGISILIVLRYTIAINDKPDQKKQIDEQILTAYRGCKFYVDSTELEKIVEKKYEEQKRINTLQRERSKTTKEEIKRQELQRANSVAYGRGRRWYFKDIPVSLKQPPKSLNVRIPIFKINFDIYKLFYSTPGNLKLRYKVFTSAEPPERLCKVLWVIGSGENRLSFPNKVKTEEFVEFSIPTSVISKDNQVEVLFFNIEQHAGVISFSFPTGIELFYPAGGFYGNYCKSFCLIFTLLCFLSLVALFASTFLTFPVAIFFSLWILFLGLIADFLKYLFPLGTELLEEKRSMWYYISQKAMGILFLIVPNLNEYNPTDYLALARIIEWDMLIKSTLDLLVIRGSLILGGMGCLIFYYREVGKPIE